MQQDRAYVEIEICFREMGITEHSQSEDDTMLMHSGCLLAMSISRGGCTRNWTEIDKTRNARHIEHHIKRRRKRFQRWDESYTGRSTNRV